MRMLCSCGHVLVVMNQTEDETGTVVKVRYGCLSEDCKMNGIEQFSETLPVENKQCKNSCTNE